MNKLVFIIPLVLISTTINFHILSELLVFDLHRCVQVTFVIFLVVFCLMINKVFGFESAIWTLRNRVIKIVFIVGAVGVIGSTLNSSYPMVAAKGMMNDFLLVATTFLLSICALNNHSYVNRLIAYTGLIGLGLYYFQFFVGFCAGILAGTSIEREVLVHHFSNIRFLNHLQVLFFPFMLALSIEADHRLIRNSASVISILTISILLFLSARAGLGCLCIAAFIVFAFSRNYRVHAKQFFWIFLTGLVFYLIFLKGFPYWLGGELAPVHVNLTSSGRWDLWLESLELLNDNWLFGVGALHYSLVSSYNFGHPHNLLLQIGLEYGVVVFGLLILFVSAFCIALYKKLSTSNLDAINGCFPFIWSLITIAGVSMFSGVWMAPLTQLLVVICIAPLLSILIENDSELLSIDNSHKSRFGAIFVKIFLLTAALSLLILIYSDVKLRFQGNVSSMQIKGIQIYAPRFWQEDVWSEK